MTRLPQASGKDVKKVLIKLGYYPVSQRGSHMKLRRDAPRRTIIVPNHTTLKRGTLKGIINDAGLSVEEFIKLLQKH